MRELRTLRSELDELNDRMVRLRYQDFKGAFVEQMRLALGQEGKRAFDSSLESRRGTSGCEMKRGCLAKQEQAISEAIGMVEGDDVEGAIALMDGLESLVCGEGSPCLDHDCSATTVESIGRVKAILGAYRGLRDRLGADLRASEAREGPEKGVRPEEMEGALAPLSNAWRLRILVMLSGNERSMSEISRELGMRTGHLQFHIKKLREAGYIVLDRKRRIYSLTAKGQRALHGAERLVSGL